MLQYYCKKNLKNRNKKPKEKLQRIVNSLILCTIFIYFIQTTHYWVFFFFKCVPYHVTYISTTNSILNLILLGEEGEIIPYTRFITLPFYVRVALTCETHMRITFFFFHVRWKRSTQWFRTKTTSRSPHKKVERLNVFFLLLII